MGAAAAAAVARLLHCTKAKLKLTVLGSRLAPSGSGEPRWGQPYAFWASWPEGSVGLLSCWTCRVGASTAARTTRVRPPRGREDGAFALDVLQRVSRTEMSLQARERCRGGKTS